MNKGNKYAVIISIISVAVFIVAVISASYAYYDYNISKTDVQEDDISVTSSKFSIDFTDGDEINIPNIVPGDSYTKEFSINNSGTRTINYKIVVQEVENNFIHKDDIVVKVIEGTNTIINTTVFPSTTNAITDSLSINADDTKDYKIVIEYTNVADRDQSDDMGHHVSGKIFIEEVTE